MDRYVDHPTIHLNNTGVAYFESGRIDEALVVFRKALEVSKQSLLDFSPPQQRQQTCGDQQRAAGSHRTEHHAQIASPPRCQSYPASMVLGGDDVTTTDFLYLNPLRIDDDGEQVVSEEEETLFVTYSLICIFNLAVVSHARATQTSHTEVREVTTRLHKALRLYELCYGLLTQEQEQGVGGVGMLMTVAIINNLGIIYKEMNMTTEAQQCFEHLVSFLSYTREYGEQEKQISLARNLDAFFGNIVQELSILKRAISAPSA